MRCCRRYADLAKMREGEVELKRREKGGGGFGQPGGGQPEGAEAMKLNKVRPDAS